MQFGLPNETTGRGVEAPPEDPGGFGNGFGGQARLLGREISTAMFRADPLRGDPRLGRAERHHAANHQPTGSRGPTGDGAAPPDGCTANAANAKLHCHTHQATIILTLQTTTFRGKS
jgi:hypothetical protein